LSETGWATSIGDEGVSSDHAQQGSNMAAKTRSAFAPRPLRASGPGQAQCEAWKIVTPWPMRLHSSEAGARARRPATMASRGGIMRPRVARLWRRPFEVTSQAPPTPAAAGGKRGSDRVFRGTLGSPRSHRLECLAGLPRSTVPDRACSGARHEPSGRLAPGLRR
jgi:hypothetical protein